ncbi:arginyltransferase [Thiorhodococcus mannitoliphagus]|uniref:Aspartate/glutamate leucyltransferase n=1 Tax=Thiorhodococcus mannitoliphagus TaxID=329406 RepID=A0A6P1DQX9_9GAMM|nr:arginyltransferase [Thiorhodococcus mannitoliphagus]NEX20667.1 arginyltransferase [Thiorhodococcus mannitoliphagus]
MTQSVDHNHGRHLSLYMTADHACSYLDDQLARTLFVDPTARIDNATYQILIDQGFRRSGAHVYRPACRGCAHCVPVRIPVNAFQPDRSQRRNWKRNASELSLVDRPSAFVDEHFALYQRYLLDRHPDGSMAEDTSEESYRRFLVEHWGGTTRFLELRLEDRLIGVAVTDVLNQGLSAVYTFFDPEERARAPGTFAVLAQIEAARRLALPYLYLGYWIGACRKMSYKERFRPIEAWDGQLWRRFERAEKLSLHGH